MKFNRKFLGIFLALGMMFSFVVVNAEHSKRDVSVEFVFNGKNMQKREKGSKDGPERFGKKFDKNKTTEKEVVYLYMVLKKAFEDGCLWNKDIKKKLVDEIFLNKNGIKLTTEISFYDSSDDFVKKLKNIVKRTNFKDIKITEDMLKSALKDMKEIRGSEIEFAINEVKNSKKALKRGDIALRMCFVNRIKKDIKEQEKSLEKLKGKDKEEGKKHLEKLKEDLKKAEKEKNEKVSKEEKEAEEQYIRNGEGFIEENKEKLKAVEKVKFNDIKNLNKDLKVSKTLIDLKTGERIAQGVFKKYLVTDDDNVTTSRTGGIGSTK